MSERQESIELIRGFLSDEVARVGSTLKPDDWDILVLAIYDELGVYLSPLRWNLPFVYHASTPLRTSGNFSRRCSQSCSLDLERPK